jgi:hypothetical protein
MKLIYFPNDILIKFQRTYIIWYKTGDKKYITSHKLNLFICELDLTNNSLRTRVDCQVFP